MAGKQSTLRPIFAIPPSTPSQRRYRPIQRLPQWGHPADQDVAASASAEIATTGRSGEEKKDNTVVFLRFPQLPVRIRLKIWKFAVKLGGRVMAINQPFQHVPGILHACKQSRKVGLEYYTLAATVNSRPFYINFEKDIVSASFYRCDPTNWSRGSRLEMIYNATTDCRPTDIITRTMLSGTKRVLVRLNEIIVIREDTPLDADRLMAKPLFWEEVQDRCPQFKELLVMVVPYPVGTVTSLDDYEEIMGDAEGLSQDQQDMMYALVKSHEFQQNYGDMTDVFITFLRKKR